MFGCLNVLTVQLSKLLQCLVNIFLGLCVCLSVSLFAGSVTDPVSCLSVSVCADSVMDPVSCLCLSVCFSVCWLSGWPCELSVCVSVCWLSDWPCGCELFACLFQCLLTQWLFVCLLVGSLNWPCKSFVLVKMDKRERCLSWFRHRKGNDVYLGLDTEKGEMFVLV